MSILDRKCQNRFYRIRRQKHANVAPKTFLVISLFALISFVIFALVGDGERYRTGERTRTGDTSRYSGKYDLLSG